MPRLIAIDLGSHSIKLTVLQGAGRRLAVEEEIEQRVPHEGPTPSSLDQRLLALEAVLEDHPEWAASGATFAATWSANEATLHQVTLPFSDRSQVEKTLPFAVEAEVPFDLDQMVLGWRVLSAGEQTRALVALVRREALRDLLDGLAARKADPRHVFVDADTLGFYAPGREPVAVIDVGHTHTLVAVAREGVVQYSRAVNVGGRDFTRAISRGLGCSWQEAERIKLGEADPTDPDEEATSPGVAVLWEKLPEKATQELEGAVGLLLAEVRSTLIAAEDLLGLEIEEARLGGGAARLPRLRGHLEQALGVPVRDVVEPDGEPVPRGQVVARAVAARLAGQTRGQEIDLRRGDLAFKGGTDLIKGVFTYGGALLAFVALASLVNFGWQYRSLSRELAETEHSIRSVVTSSFADISEVRDGTTAVAIMSERTRDAVSRAQVLARGADDVPPTVDRLLALTRAFPPHPQVEVNVSELTMTPATITFNAETDGYGEAASVEEHIKREQRFRDASKSNERRQRDKVVFTITIPLGEKGEG